MGRKRYRDCLWRVDELTAAQHKEVEAMRWNPPESAASVASTELGVDDERGCPYYGADGGVSRSKARGLRRFRCIRSAGRRSVRSRARRCRGCTTMSASCALGLAWCWRYDQGVRRALRDCAEHGTSLTPPLPGGRSSKYRTGLPGSLKRTRRWFWRAGKGSGSWAARRAGGAAKPRSAASRASRCRFWWAPIMFHDEGFLFRVPGEWNTHEWRPWMTAMTSFANSIKGTWRHLNE